VSYSLKKGSQPSKKGRFDDEQKRRRTERGLHRGMSDTGIIQVFSVFRSFVYHISVGQQVIELEHSSSKMQALKGTLPFLLITNVQARSLVKKQTSWTNVTILTDAECNNQFAFKMKALSQSPFGRTVFVDNDIIVQGSSFITNLLSIDSRYLYMAPASPSGHFMLGKHHTNMRHTLLCSCLIVYASSVSHIFQNALGNLCSKSRPNMMRQSDQEYLWFEMGHLKKQINVLPQESYCEKRYLPHRNALNVTGINVSGVFRPCWSLHAHSM
jgi:hypothetical protein